MANSKSRSQGLWVKCSDCGEILYHREVTNNFHVCPRCGYHFRISADLRLGMLFDNGKYKRLFGKIRSSDPLGFVDSKPYPDRLKVYNKKFAGSDAVVIAQGEIHKVPAIVAAMEYGFMGGSMGSAVGEKLTRAIERCIDRKLPLIIVSCSGGARMQEGILSLMQLGKVSAALARLREKRLPYVSILTDPTTGGVTASFAMLGDLNIAEPGALIGFAGPRVIEQTIRQTLPEGFQRSEFLLEHGMLDMVVPRPELKGTVSRCLSMLR
ncbi:MAG: acetyl-CoA carboxylase, carboxyltransferase subunit beta [Acidobacteria bacterium]|jgi:acetyl-CoA carboxylase carboxyl transferase subunit beta|nr:acetyl-CoA carboxylase, carboxyltransferase subunit beta [Acidobacteriota bacterium]